MSGVIDIELVNNKVKEIEAKKRAIEEATELGKKALESQKIKPIKKVGLRSSFVAPIGYGDGSYSNYYEACVSGNMIHSHGAYSNSSVSLSKEELIRFAACVIKAFGPIDQAEIDAVVVE